MQRFAFNKQVQRKGETEAKFVAKLRKLSEQNQFGASLNEKLRDRLVCGVKDGRLQRRLLAEPDLTLRKAFELCQASELAEKNAKELQAGQKQSQKMACAYYWHTSLISRLHEYKRPDRCISNSI